MKKWQIENSGTSEVSKISEILFRVFLFPRFRFCPIAKIENSDLKILEKISKLSEISEFSEFSKFSTWPFGTPSLFFLKGGVNFNHFPWRVGGLWKMKKIGWKYGAGTDLLKMGLELFLFNFFKVDYFYI